MPSIRCVSVRVLVVAVAAGMVTSMLTALPASANWVAPPAKANVTVTPPTPGDLFLGAAGAPKSDQRGGSDPRADDGVSFDGPAFVPAARTIGSSTQRTTPVSPVHKRVRELTERRGASEEWWLNDDGTVTKLSFSQPKYFDAGGAKFVPVDTNVIADATRAGWFANTAGALRFEFGPIGGGGDGGVEVSLPGRDPIRFWPSFAKPAGKGGVVAPNVGTGLDANKVSYGDVAPGVDLEYTVTPGGLSERIVLRAPTKISDWSFEVEGVQLQAKKDGNGKDSPNVFESTDPADRFVLAGAQVIDRNGEPRKDANKATVQRNDALADRAPKKAGGKATNASKFTVGIDAAWLASLSDTDFPVIIDPTVADTGVYRTAFNDQGWTPGLNAYQESFAGRNPAGTSWRSFVQYQNFKDPYSTTTEIADAHIELTSSLGWEFDQTSPVEAHAPYSPNYWDWNFTSFDPTVISTAQLSDHAVLDVTSLVRSWLSNGWSYGAVAFKGDESVAGTKKAFFATLVTTYDTNLPPAGISHPNPPDNGVTELDNPTLTVEPVIDPRGATVTYQYEISTVPDFSSIAITSAWLSTPSYTIANGALDSATTWYWRVKTNDQWGSITTPTSGFTLRRTAFGYNGFSGYFKGLNTLGGNYVFTETDAQLPSTGLALDLTRTFNTENTKIGVFGKGWSTPYFMTWETSGANIVVTYPDGRRETHTPNGSGGWTPPAGFIAQLAGSPGGGFTLTQGDHTVETFAAGSTSGSLSQITDPVGHVLNVDVSQLAANKTILITDVASQRSITVTTNVSTVPFLITKAEIANPAGGTFAWTYTYDTTIPAAPRLTSACDARGTTGFCKTYEWETVSPYRLLRVKDRKGQLDVQFGYSTYGGRVTLITDALGAVTTFTYNQAATAPYDITVQMTDARTNVWRQDYTNTGLFIREYVPGVTNPWMYSYDPLTKMRTKSSDPNGNSSTVAYTADLRADVETNAVGNKTYKVHDGYGNTVKVCDGRSVDANNDRVPDADTYCTLFGYGTTAAQLSSGLIRSKNVFGLAPETYTYTGDTGSGDTLAYGSTTLHAPDGLVKTHTDAAGKTTVSEYTAAGDVARVSDNTGPGTGGGSTRYEAEAASNNYTFDNTTATTPAFSGTGYEKYGNWSGSSIVWTVTAPTAGTYTMTVRSTSGYASATNRQMSINGGASSTVTFLATSWTVWADTTFNVNLNAGSNTIGFTYDASTGSSDAYFDYIDIAGTGGVGKDARYTYDSLGRMLTATDISDTYPAGVTTTYAYDAVSNIVTRTDPSVTNTVTSVAHQQRTTFTYDANSNRTDAVVSDVTGGDVTRTTHTDFDIVDRAWQTTDPEGNVTQRRFDTVGNIVHARDGEGRWVRTTYNARNLPVGVDALGVVANPDTATSVRVLSQTEYDVGGRTTASVDARGQRVEYAFDTADRATTTIMRNYRDDLPSGTARDVLISSVDSYNAANMALAVSEGGAPGGTPLRTTTFGYDNQGRKISTGISSVGMLETVSYDAMSRLLVKTTARSGVAAGGVSTAETRTSYDLAGRVSTSTVENGATDLVTTNTYDLRGVVKTTTDPRGNTITYTSDQLGRTVTATAPAVNVETGGGAPTVVSPARTVGYNTFGNLTHAKNERGFVTSTAYDKLGRATSITYPSYTAPTGGAAIVATESFVFDHVGNQTAHTDRRGFTTNYSFDIYNKALTQLDPSISGGSRGQTTLTYDSNENVLSSTDPTGALSMFTYDSMNRPRKKTDVVTDHTVNAVLVPGGNYTTVIDHDDLGRITKTTSPQGVVKATTVDALGEATIVKNTTNTTIATASYDAVGHVVIADDGLGRETRTAFDTAGRATSTGAYASSAATTAVTSTSATYDPNGNIIAVVDGNGNTTTANFDALGRLSSVVAPVSASKSITTSYGYDAAGNLTRVRDGRGVSPSPFITDAFTGSNGALWSPLRWSTGVSTSSVIDIQSSSGHLQVPASNNGWARATDDATAPRNAGSTMQDADITASVKASSIGGGLTTRIWARASGAWNTTNNYLQTAGYALVLNQASNTVAVTKMTTAANTETSLGSASFTYAVNTLYKVRFEVVGSTIRARIWNSTGSEPSTWNVTATDSTFASGVTAVSVNTGANSTIRDVYVDDVAVTPATSASALTAYDTINTYNSWGLAETVVEAATGTQANVNQRTFTRVYNAGGLAVTDIQPDGTTSGIQITAAFDELGRMTSESAAGLTKTFGYDLAGRRTSIGLPTGGTQTFTYDERSLPIGSAGTAGTTTAKFNGDSQLTWRQDPSGLANYHYNTVGLADQVGDASTGATLNMTFNTAYQPTRVDYGTPGSTTPYRTYTYDSIGRKASDVVTVGATTKYNATYTYDANNNMLTENVKNLFGASSTDELYTYTYDWANRLTSDSRKIGTGAAVVTNDTYDDAGNRTSNGTKTWSYDQRGRTLTGPEGNSTWDPRGTLDKTVTASNTVIDYTFDALGRLLGYNGNGSVVNYRYDALDRIYDRTNTTTSQTTVFAYSGSSTKPAATTLSGSTKGYSRGPAGDLIGVKNGATARFAGTNQHTDLRFLFDTTGAVTDTKTYDPTGNVLASTGTTGSDLGYQSEYTDPTSNNVWMAARWYNPATATFQSRDSYAGTSGNPISLNRYTYAGSGYLNATDPTGHAPGDIAGILQLPWEDGSCSAGFYTGGFLGLCQQDTGRYASDCTANAMIIDLNGTCIKPWSTGDACGTNGTRGYDVNMCVERQNPGTACNWNGADGTIADDQITCAPKPPTSSGGINGGTTVMCESSCSSEGIVGQSLLLFADALPPGLSRATCPDGNRPFLGLCAVFTCGDYNNSGVPGFCEQQIKACNEVCLEATMTCEQVAQLGSPRGFARDVMVETAVGLVHPCMVERVQAMLLGMFLFNISESTRPEDRVDIGTRTDAWRDSNVQFSLRTRNCPDPVNSDSGNCNPPTAKVGTSNHEVGLAIDFDTRSIGTNQRNVTPDTPLYRWLRDNANQYGLCQLPSEAWHWSFNCG